MALERYLTWSIALLFFLRLPFAVLLELSPQEAYYWNYAIHPALSYFDHPPMVAWIIKPGTIIFGKTEIGVRIGGLLLTLFSTWLIYLLGRLWFDRKAGLWAALLFQSIPLYFVYGTIITPDAPLIFFWLLTLYWLSIALLKDQKWAWYPAGVALGLAMLSKYTGIFLIPSALLFLALDPRNRVWLLRKEPYWALVLAFLVFSPVILWNYQHEWASFSFQFSARLSEQSTDFPRDSIAFLLTQMGALFPTLFVGLLVVMIVTARLSKAKHPAKWKLCFFFAFPTLIFFLFYSSRAWVKVNWTMPGYLSLLLTAYPIYRYVRFNGGAKLIVAVRRSLLATFYALPILYGLGLYHMTATIPYVPLNKWVMAWEEFARIVDQEKKHFEAETRQGVILIAMDTHYVASALAFYTDRVDDVFARNLVGETSLAFGYWEARRDPKGLNALAVDTRSPNIEILRKHFDRVDDSVRTIPVVKGGTIIRRVHLVRCYGYRNSG